MALDISKFDKQPWEIYPIAINFENNIDSGESIIVGSSLVIAYDESGEDVSDTVLVSGSIAVINNTKLRITVQAGSDKERYKISFRAYISSTKKLEDDVYMNIKD